MSKPCLICDRIAAIKAGMNPYFVAETKSGYVVIGDHQFFRGYTLLLSKNHVRELHELPTETRQVFLMEMSEVAAAVFRAFKPVKLNYELLGNTDEHLHWHIIPRHTDDPRPRNPAWLIDPSLRDAETTRPDPVELQRLIEDLRAELLKTNASVTE